MELICIHVILMYRWKRLIQLMALLESWFVQVLTLAISGESGCKLVD